MNKKTGKGKGKKEERKLKIKNGKGRVKKKKRLITTGRNVTSSQGMHEWRSEVNNITKDKIKRKSQNNYLIEEKREMKIR